MRRIAVILIVTLAYTNILFSQESPKPIKEIKFFVDTSVYYLSKHSFTKNETDYLYFEYTDEEQVCDVWMFPDYSLDVKNLRLKESGDYQFIDSFINVNNEYLRFKIQFDDLNQSEFLKFTVLAEADSNTIIQEINLFPITKTVIKFYPLDDALFIGEEKIFELICNNADNIRIATDWTSNLPIDYWITEKFGQLQLHLMPNQTGKKPLQLELSTKKPFIDENQELIYQLPIIEKEFYVKKSRLRYLHINEKDITLNEISDKDGMEIQIENTTLLKLNKTYRIEDQEESGGPLVAELYTRRTLANNKVLCWLRTYNYHRTTEGYLYIKDGDLARFITNFNITPKTTISKISVLHDGKNWTENLSVYPGEKISILIEGEGLHKADFHFEDVYNYSTDSLIKSENRAEFKLEIPVDISKKTISIFNHSKATGFNLSINEYQDPRGFDFIFIDYSGTKNRVSGIRGHRKCYSTIKDVDLSFSNLRIDSGDKLYGKQYLNFDIVVRDKNNKLIEMKKIENVVVCPDTKSPRYPYYEKNDCSDKVISLNNYLRTKTYELPEWSKIDITVSHDKTKHNGSGLKKDIEIIQARKYKFDIEVSFPAGLITAYKQEKQLISNGDTSMVEEMDFGSLGGISLAMIAQFSFYHPDKIAKYRPYKVGAGFIAMNAFNFADGANKDLGLVILGSLYPTTKDTKLTFPLFLGGGYLLKEGRLFFLVGPGIRVSL